MRGFCFFVFVLDSTGGILFCCFVLKNLTHFYIYIYISSLLGYFFSSSLSSSLFFVFFLLQAGDLTYLQGKGEGVERDKQKIYIYIICIYILFVRWLFSCVLCFVN